MDPVDTQSILDRVIKEAIASYAANPGMKMYAGHIGDTAEGGWTFLVMEGEKPFGAYTFTPPSDAFSREEYAHLLNTTDRGQLLMRESVEEVGGTVKEKFGEFLLQALSALPTPITKH